MGLGKRVRTSKDCTAKTWTSVNNPVLGFLRKIIVCNAEKGL